MKRSLIPYVVVWGVFMAVCMADPAGSVPSGPLLKRMGDFSAMQVTYSYSNDHAKPAAGAASAPPTPAPPLDYVPAAPPRVVTLTRTNPAWHVARVDTFGN